MNERSFRMLGGLVMLAALYLELPALMWGLIAVYLFEGLSNWRVPALVTRLRGRPAEEPPPNVRRVFNMEAERAGRLVAALVLILTYGVFYQQLWFFPWFMGFAFFGAGLSGVCPLILSLRYAGFR